MGIRDQMKIFRRGRSRESSRRKSLFNLVAPNQVTEQSLQVWRALPAQIRQDPSLASFQMENERLHGTSPNGDQYSNSDEIESTPEESNEGSEFINMKIFKPKADREKCSLDPKSSDGEDRHSIDHPSNALNKTKRQIQTYAKDVCLIAVWIAITLTLICTDEQSLLKKRLIVPEYDDRLYYLPQNPAGNFRLTLHGAFTELNNFTTNFLTVQLQVVRRSSWNDSEVVEDFMDPWVVPIAADEEVENAKIRSKNRTFILPPGLAIELEDPDEARIRMKMFTNGSSASFPLQVVYDALIVNVGKGVVMAAMILIVFYAMLVSEVLHKTFTAMICSSMAIAVLAILGDRPTMEEILVWMDMEMLTLIFAMMILVAFLTETGVFDYLAVLTFEISGGKIWPLIYSLCVITCLVSSVLDNMTTVLLMTPVAVRLSEVMELDPVPVILGIIAHSNIGGAITPIGDPISIIICSNHFIAKNGVTFFNFVAHTLPGVIFIVIQSCLYMRLMFWDVKTLRLNEPKALKDLRREIKVWQRAAYSLSSYSKDVDLVRETLLKKVKILKHKLKKMQAGLGSTDAYKHTLEELKAAYPIKQKKLLVLSSITLLFVIVMFFVQSVPSLKTLPLGWVALLGVALLMITANRDDMDAMMTRIEWSTLLFFAAMFIIMECVERLGLFTWIGTQTENIILFVAKENRLATAIFFILWISALASAILDSIPVAAMMVKVVVSLVAKESLGLPLQPLVWALVFGSCLGGNGTLYGSSANVLSAGIAEQHGYKISFTRYLKVVFPMMIGQVTVITAYLMVAHIIYEWH